jgi:NAD(P)-dependent dehydrogenase (short-subunit alcohol dehydrogenase family)
VVVGASGGVGSAVAGALVEDGMEVHGLDLRPSDGDWAFHKVDVTDPQAVHSAIERIGATGCIHALVYAAGYQVQSRRLDALTVDVWKGLIAANLDGAFYSIRASLPYLSGSPSDVILISSVSALWPDVSGPAYQAAKAGLVALARAIGIEDRGRRLRCSVLMPGLIDTPLLDQRPIPPDERMRAAALRPQDIAEVCRFLLRLPGRVHVPELTILPTGVQVLGDSIEARLPASGGDAGSATEPR